jgi:choice-of-anchor C domain-containing protein
MMAAATSASANLITNGSFESGPAISGGLLTINAPDSTTLPGWTVSANDLEVITSAIWPAADGDRSLDLNGLSNAALYQDVAALTPGAQYRLSFALSGNPFTGNDPVGTGDVIKNLRVTAGSTVGDFAFDVTPYHVPEDSPVADMGWRAESMVFTATDALQRIEFASLDPGNSFRGPALDNVSLVMVPEPTAISTLVLACLAGLYRRR